jgi:type III secretion protein C
MKFLFNFFLLILYSFSLFGEQKHICSFPKIKLAELLRYTAKIAGVNFIADEKLLDFDVVFISSNGNTPDDLIKDLFVLLKEYKLEAVKEGNSFIIRKLEEKQISLKSKEEFNFYKLKYHHGSEILPHITAAQTTLSDDVPLDFLLKKAISSLQWVQSSNTFFYSANKEVLGRMMELIDKFDTPLKQVYVEVLVIETDISRGHDFGVSWKDAPSNDILTACKNSLTGNIDMGIIGDAIINGKQIFSELTSFVKYLNSDTNTSIILNQKILAKENKLSTIFEGNNVPFAGSVIELTGANQRTTSNIEYKDIGVMLNITPMIGANDIISLAIDEKITESHDFLIDGSTNLSGIKTSKTQMTTDVHVPNDHFLVLSGMTRKIKTIRKSGVPILRSIPLIGRIFSSEKEIEVKKSLIIFVRPHIVKEL